MAKKDVATNDETAVIPFIQTEVPAHVQEGTGLGNEGVSAEDMTIPRLSLLQQLSPQLDRSKAEFIDGAQAGQFLNSVTNELFDEIYVVNLCYKKLCTAFKKRNLGGGFAGNYTDSVEAREALIADNLDPDSYDLADTANHYLLLLDSNGVPVTPILFSMAKSKLRISNQWNTNIAHNGGDRFAGVWKMRSVNQTSSNGSFSNVQVDFMGWASPELYAEAKEYYKQFASINDALEAAE